MFSFASILTEDLQIHSTQQIKQDSWGPLKFVLRSKKLMLTRTKGMKLF